MNQYINIMRNKKLYNIIFPFLRNSRHSILTDTTNNSQKSQNISWVILYSTKSLMTKIDFNEIYLYYFEVKKFIAVKNELDYEGSRVITNKMITIMVMI